MDSVNIDILVQKSVQDDKDAFAQLLEEVGRSILYMCIKLTGNKQDGEDAAQEVFIRLQKNIHRLKNPAVFRVWLNRIVVSTCTDQWRKNAGTTDAAPIEDHMEKLIERKVDFLPADYAEEKDKRELLLQAINALPPHYREVVMLHYYQGLKQAEIASILHVPVHKVEYNLRMAKAAIRKDLETKQKDTSFRSTYGLVGLPVVTRILQDESQTIVSSADLLRVIRASGATQAAMGGAAAITAGKAALAAKVLVAAFVGLATAFTAVTALGTTASPNLPIASTSAYAQVDVPQQMPESITEPEALEIRPASVASVSVSTSIPVQPPQAAGPHSTMQEVETGAGTPPTAPVPQPTALPGRVAFKDKEGNVVPGGEKYAAGLIVVLSNIEGQQLASEPLGESGTFRFENISVPQGGPLRVQLVLPHNRKAAFTADNPTGEVAVTLQSGVGVQPEVQLFITDAIEPTGRIVFGGGGQAGGLQNPQTATLTVGDETDTTATWRLLAADGAVLYSGSGTYVEEELQQLQGRVGEYYLVFTLIDAAGNAAEVSAVFVVVV